MEPFSPLPLVMLPRVDPRDSYRRAIVAGTPREIVAAAHRCPTLSVEEALPALVALLSKGAVYDRAVERWVRWFEPETATDEREVGLIRAALESLKGVDATAAVGADALMQLMDIRGPQLRPRRHAHMARPARVAGRVSYASASCSATSLARTSPWQGSGAQ